MLHKEKMDYRDKIIDIGLIGFAYFYSKIC